MEINNVTISFGTKQLYSEFSVSFPDYKITAIMGPSGIGKTTLLNKIAFDIFPKKISYIFQEPRLLPWCSIEKNIMLAIQPYCLDTHSCKKRSQEYLDRVGLLTRHADYPDQLSGGERQRVSIARAFACESPILLMDEPFQSQDQKTKNLLISIVKKMQQEDQKTIVAVTHDIRETIEIADKIILLHGQPVKIIHEEIFSFKNDDTLKKQKLLSLSNLIDTQY